MHASPLRQALNARQMQALERCAEILGMPPSILMENAGRALAKAALELAKPHSCFFVVCGPGNNGGDGFVCARVLASHGLKVFLTSSRPVEQLKGDALRNAKLCQVYTDIVWTDTLDLNQLRPEDLVVDAVFGTGLWHAPQGVEASLIEAIVLSRRKGAKVLSADLPSGLQADEGRADFAHVQADLSLALGAPKPCHFLYPAAMDCGKVLSADIGIPLAAWEAIVQPGLFLLEETTVRPLFSKRPQDSHKGSFGHVLVVAGSPGKSGAASLCAKAALRAGAGLVTLASSEGVLSQALHNTPELMGHGLPGKTALGLFHQELLLHLGQNKAAIAIGPGIQTGPETAELLFSLIAQTPIPVVLDADALNALPYAQLERLQSARCQPILSPHPGEMAHLMNMSTSEVQARRAEAAMDLARRTLALVVLKGAGTLIASPEGTLTVNTSGTPGMATAGSGDILTGLLVGLLAQGMSTVEACQAAVFLHGAAGEWASCQHGERGMLASDILEGVGHTYAEWKL
ncbi:MAG: NAD(P)H-hydrate dehydratase [Cystobacterineae bacterium]|nr:NAD(P)H-hydrate dehydratase [Cystobacterineae bacterium]